MKNKNICLLAIDELKTLKHLKENFEQDDDGDSILIYHIPVF